MLPKTVSFFSGFQEGEDGGAQRAALSPLSPSPFASGQQGLVQECDAFSRASCPVVEPGKCRTAHSDPT